MPKLEIFLVMEDGRSIPIGELPFNFALDLKSISNQLLKKSIAELPLSKRASAALEARGIKTLENLLGQTKRGLRKPITCGKSFSTIGTKTLNEIIDLLSDFNLYLED